MNARIERALLERVERELAIRSFPHFVRRFWGFLESKRKLVWNWYVDALCAHLEAVSRGEIKDLVINVPPRTGKSTIVSVLWPAWDWLSRPDLRWFTVSYVDDLATRDALRSRRIIESPDYQILVRHAAKQRGEQPWRLATDQNVKTRYENDRTGTRISAGIGGKATGYGGDRRIIDDAHHAMDAENPERLKYVVDWYKDVFASRKEDETTATTVAIMQRVAKGDLSGELLENHGFGHFCVPLVYESDHPYRNPSPLGWRDPRKPGESVFPTRFPEDVIAKIKRRGSRHWATQWQQRPEDQHGAIFKRGDFKRYRTLPAEFDEVLISADLRFKGTRVEEVSAVAELSWVVFQVWGMRDANAYLIDEARGQWSFAESVRQVIALSKRYPEALRKLVEAKANGDALVSVLEDKIPGLILVEPRGSKIQRAYSVQGLVEAGNVWIPDSSAVDWIEGEDGWLDEVAGFPFRRHNDRVDAMTQALIHGRALERELDAHIDYLSALGSS
jgi:predicted phage terminase large subunit-like protein